MWLISESSAACVHAPLDQSRSVFRDPTCLRCAQVISADDDSPMAQMQIPHMDCMCADRHVDESSLRVMSVFISAMVHSYDS